MPEGGFAIITPMSQQLNVHKLLDFLNKNEVPRIQVNTLADKYIEITSDTCIEFSGKELASLCQSILSNNEWFRVFENDEYSLEGFWYIDKETSWRICTSQETPNARTLRAYRLWHEGLDGISYGAIGQAELLILEQKYCLRDADGNPMQEPSPPLREQVGVNAGYVGQGIQVPHAGEYWDWYIPDHECLATNLARTCDFPPNDQKIQYRRSYIIEGDIGYIWSWKHKSMEIFLVFAFFGESGTYIRLVQNFGEIDINDIILAVYFEDELEEGFDEPEEWSAGPDTNDFSHKPLQNIDDGPFDAGASIRLFEGKVMSPYQAVLMKRDGQCH